MLSKIIGSIEKSRFTTTVISLRAGGDLVSHIRGMGVEVIELGIGDARSTLAGAIELWRQFREIRPDVVQTWLYHADMLGFVVGRLAGVGALAWNIRCSDMGPEYYRGVTGMVVRCNAFFSKWADAIVTNSQAGRTSHELLGYDPNNWHVIPNGFELDKFRPNADSRSEFRKELGLSEDSIVIGLIARLDPVKGHETFLGAASELIGRHQDLHFVLVGEGCLRGQESLDKMVPSNLDGRLHALGRREDIPLVTQALDIAVSASDTEGFSNTIGEAMACAVPCVVTDAGDNAWIVGENGFVVPTRNPGAMAEALHRMLEGGAEFREQLGRRARARVVDNFSIAAVTRQYEELYRSMAGAEFLTTSS